MRQKLHVLVRASSIVCVLSCWAAAATAQTTVVRVIADQATIWSPDFVTTAAVVRTGTVMTVVGRRGDWYEVVIPANGGTSNRRGMIYKGNVELVSKSTASVSARPTATGTTSRSGASGVGVDGFVEFGYTRFAAHQSFDALLGHAGGLVFGGGAEIRGRPGWFVNGSVERFSQTGQRVLVVDGDLFKLGIPDTISLTPVALGAGWRFENERVTPYFGAGAGEVFYSEQSNFVDPSANVSSGFIEYRVFGGVEFRNEWVGTAFEVEYSRVPGALGVGGVSAVFHESNLGGVVGRIKILVGR